MACLKLRRRSSEAELVRLVTNGKSLKENARDCGISYSALKARLNRLERRWGVRDLAQLVHYAHCLGVLSRHDNPPPRAFLIERERYQRHATRARKSRKSRKGVL